jgi:hypothetical protein
MNAEELIGAIRELDREISSMDAAEVIVAKKDFVKLKEKVADTFGVQEYDESDLDISMETFLSLPKEEQTRRQEALVKMKASRPAPMMKSAFNKLTQQAKVDFLDGGGEIKAD